VGVRVMRQGEHVETLEKKRMTGHLLFTTKQSGPTLIREIKTFFHFSYISGA
jgi:hypothetical protein